MIEIYTPREKREQELRREWDRGLSAGVLYCGIIAVVIFLYCTGGILMVIGAPLVAAAGPALLWCFCKLMQWIDDCIVRGRQRIAEQKRRKAGR